MSTTAESWHAEFEGSTLHISGTATYPNNFSTATLDRLDAPQEEAIVVYKVIFHRDKEPFCGADLIGPVHYFERYFPADAHLIRVLVGDGEVEIPVPR